jgi:hypothetical protein
LGCPTKQASPPKGSRPALRGAALDVNNYLDVVSRLRINGSPPAGVPADSVPVAVAQARHVGFSTGPRRRVRGLADANTLREFGQCRLVAFGSPPDAADRAHDHIPQRDLRFPDQRFGDKAIVLPSVGDGPPRGLFQGRASSSARTARPLWRDADLRHTHRPVRGPPSRRAGRLDPPIGAGPTVPRAPAGRTRAAPGRPAGPHPALRPPSGPPRAAQGTPRDRGGRARARSATRPPRGSGAAGACRAPGS